MFGDFRRDREDKSMRNRLLVQLQAVPFAVESSRAERTLKVLLPFGQGAAESKGPEGSSSWDLPEQSGNARFSLKLLLR